jgi:hypothetical protein
MNDKVFSWQLNIPNGKEGCWPHLSVHHHPESVVRSDKVVLVSSASHGEE